MSLGKPILSRSPQSTQPLVTVRSEDGVPDQQGVADSTACRGDGASGFYRFESLL
jgi:hypothetical protein